MNRPRLVGLFSAALGSTAAFLILSRWSLIGTITGAILMPIIFTLASFGSHETIERAGKWVTRRVSKETAEPDGEDPESQKTDTPSPEMPRPFARGLQWSVVILAVFAFSVSLYSLVQGEDAKVTILREKVIETVTVTTEQPSMSFARDETSVTSEAIATASTLEEPATTETSTGQQNAVTTTTDPSGQDDPPATTVSTDLGLEGDTTTTLP